MRSRKPPAIPARLEATRRRFERWRRARKGHHSRIPASLWTSAVKLAGAYGLCRTARTLRLDYNALKKRINSAEPHNSSGQEPATDFVELVPPQRACLPECIVELEHPRGAKMRIHLKGIETPDMAALIRSTSWRPSSSACLKGTCTPRIEYTLRRTSVGPSRPTSAIGRRSVIRRRPQGADATRKSMRDTALLFCRTWNDG